MNRPPTSFSTAGILDSDRVWLTTGIIAACIVRLTGAQWLLHDVGAIASASSWTILGGVTLWLAAGAVGVFPLPTINLVRHRRTIDRAAAADNRRIAGEPVTVIGGMMARALASHRRGNWRERSVR